MTAPTYSIIGGMIVRDSAPGPDIEPSMIAPAFTSCHICGVESRGRCCQACWSSRCVICGQVIWRDENGLDYGRGMRHARCESAGRPVPRPKWMMRTR